MPDVVSLDVLSQPFRMFLKVAGVSADGASGGSWFQRRIADGKNE